MNCGDISEGLIAYLNSRADSAEWRELDEHLAGCAKCRMRAEQFRALGDVLNEMPTIEPSFTFDARLRERVAAEPVRRWYEWLVPQPRLALAAVFLALLAVWVVKETPVKKNSGATVAAVQQQEDFNAIKNLDVLENYEVVTSMDALSQLLPPDASNAGASQQN